VVNFVLLESIPSPFQIERGTSNFLTYKSKTMKIKYTWFIVILSWTLFLYHIIMPFTGIVEREWGSMTVWAVLSIVWTSHLIDDKEKKEDDEKKNKEEEK
jgi:hypothetical protein